MKINRDALLAKLIIKVYRPVCRLSRQEHISLWLFPQANLAEVDHQCDTTEPEVENLLKETIVETGMSTEKIQIKCPAKPITHAFSHFIESDERNKYVR